MPVEPNWEQLLSGIDFTKLPEGDNKAPMMETVKKEPPESKMVGRKVFVQKVVTEVWIYTDIEGKSFGHQGIQDIVVVGEMQYDDAIKLIGERKTRRRKSG